MTDYTLLETTMQHIVDHPEQHNQSMVWSCGTPACFVGHAQALSGMTYQDYLRIPSDIQWAAKNLHISENDVHVLFDSLNTIPMLQAMVKDIVNGSGLQDENFYEEYREDTE